MKLNSVIILIALMSFSNANKLQSQPKKLFTVQNIDAKEFFKISETEANCVIIDVRTKREFRKGHIENSILAENKETLNRISDTLDFDQPLLIYCDEGTRSITACTILKEKGFLKVYNLEYGLIEWKKSGFKLH